MEQTHGRRGEVKRLKDQLTVLQQKLERSEINDTTCQGYNRIFLFHKLHTLTLLYSFFLGFQAIKTTVPGQTSTR